MRYLVVVPHGQHDFRTHVLTMEGVGQMCALAKNLKSVTGDEPVALLTSDAERAARSAAVLAEELGIGRYEKYPVLEWHEGKPRELPGVAALIEENADVHTVMLVTHGGYAEEIAEYYMTAILKAQVEYMRVPQKGEALVVDRNTKQVRIMKG